MNNIPEPTAKRQKTIFDFFRAGPSGRDRRDVQVESSASVTEDPDGNLDLAIVNAGHEAPTSPSSNAPEGVSDAGKEPAGAELIEPEQPNPFGNSSADKGLCRYGRCETAHPGDIGRLVSKRENLTDQDRLHALKERWVPANRDEFPTCHHDNDGKSRPRRCTEKTLRDFPWLAVSQFGEQTGAWCVSCLLFGVSDKGGGQKLGNLSRSR